MKAVILIRTNPFKGFKPLKEFISRRILFFMFLSLIVSAAFSQTPQYELNDPRNPDCPCHKAQKQAEEEYAKLNPANPDKQIHRETITPEKNNAPVTAANTAVSASLKTKRKNKTGWIRKSMFRYGRKHRGIKKMHTDYAVCFHNW